MSANQSHNVSAYDVASRLNLVIEWLLLALLAFMPFAFGAVQAWSEQVIVVVAAAMTLLLAVRILVCADAPFKWTWGLLPLALFLMLVAVQLLPLPQQLLSKLSPAAVAHRQELLGDVPNAQDVLSWQSLSLYPQSTAHDLRMLLAVVAVFVVVLNVHRRTQQVKRLLLGIALIGATVALLGLWQFLSGATAVYGTVSTSNSASGPFLNHSHFGQFMNLSVGAALGLIFVYAEEVFEREEASFPILYQRIREGKIRMVWLLAGIIVLCAAMVFVSMTRGGMVSLLVAGAFTAVVLTLSRRQPGRASLLLLLGLALFLVLLYLEFDRVYNRAASILHVEKSEGGRGQILRDLVPAWKQFPVFGTGLGTHETVFPMFDRSNSTSIAGHAENEYAQLMEETGSLGLGLMLVFLGWIGWNYRRCIKRIKLPVQAAAYGLGFGLAAILVHSFTDFGQHLPANACLTAASAALLTNLAWRGRSLRKELAPAGSHRSYLRAALGAAVPLALFGLLSWTLPAANAARRAETNWGAALGIEARLEDEDWQEDDDVFKLLHYAQLAVELQPKDIEYQYGLNEYRWRAISRTRDPETGDVLMDEASLQFARRIVADLHRVRPLCPTFGMPYSLAGQIETFVLNEPSGREHIRRGYALSSWDADAAFTAATLDARDGYWDGALEKLRAAVARHVPSSQALEVLLRGDRADLAMSLAAGDADALRYMAARLEKSESQGDVARAARAEARRLLAAKCERPDAQPADLACLAGDLAAEGDHSRAIELYRRALTRSYDNVNWRMGLARSLAAVGQTQSAMHEARICLRLRPQYAAAKGLIGELSVIRGAGTGE